MKKLTIDPLKIASHGAKNTVVFYIIAGAEFEPTTATKVGKLAGMTRALASKCINELEELGFVDTTYLFGKSRIFIPTIKGLRAFGVSEPAKKKSTSTSNEFDQSNPNVLSVLRAFQSAHNKRKGFAFYPKTGTENDYLELLKKAKDEGVTNPQALLVEIFDSITGWWFNHQYTPTAINKNWSQVLSSISRNQTQINSSKDKAKEVFEQI
jgi:hypothetical protein